MELLGKVYLHPAADDKNIVRRMSHRLIPVYGEIPCGIPNSMDDGLKGYLEIPNGILGDGEFFALRAKGVSMIDAGIYDGDLIIVRKQSFAEDAQIVVAFVDGETTLKRLYKNSEHQLIELRPENERYQTIYTSECTILGIAVKIIKDLG